MLRILKALWIRVRADGPGPALHGILDGLRPKNWGVYQLRDAGALKSPAVVPAVHSDLARLASLRRGFPDLCADFYRDTAGRCDRCFYALDGDRPTGILWVLSARHPSRLIALEEGEAELAFVFVQPEFRGRGLAKALVRHACRTLLGGGMHTIYALILDDNAPSTATFRACGFEKVMTFRRAALAGRPRRVPGPKGVIAGDVIQRR